VLSVPVVDLDGDHATAVNHSRVYVHRDGEWRLARVSANRWTLRRDDGRWRVELRTNRLLDGDPDARALLATGDADE
jgi:ketosteroid isomerase-like protein